MILTVNELSVGYLCGVAGGGVHRCQCLSIHKKVHQTAFADVGSTHKDDLGHGCVGLGEVTHATSLITTMRYSRQIQKHGRWSVTDT